MGDAIGLMAQLVLPSGARWGEVATPVQLEDARAVLGGEGPRRTWLGRARGYSKTEDAAAMTVAVMLSDLEPDDEAICVARDRDQARIIIDRVRGYVRRTPELAGALKVDQHLVTSRAGVRLRTVEADAGSAYGLLPVWVTCDEICQWPDTAGARTLWEAISTSLPKHAKSRAVLISTAGDPGHWSRKVYEHALADPLWSVRDTHGPAPWMDAAELESERRRLPASSWLRLFENRWAAGEDRLLDHEDVAACLTLDGPLEPVAGRRYVLGVDLALRRDSAVVACGSRVDDQVVIDHLDVFEPRKGRDIDLSAVEDCVLARARQYRASAVFDPAMGQQMIQRLRKQGTKVVEHTFTVSSNSARTLTLLQLVREHRLRIPRSERTAEELVNLRVREVSPNVYRHDHDPSRHDDIATAISLVAHHLVSRPARGRLHFTGAM